MVNQKATSSRNTFIALLASCMLALVAMLAMAAPAQAETSYEISVQNTGKINCVDYGFFGVPGKKATFTLSLYAIDEDYNRTKVSGAGFAYQGDAKLNGTLTGSTLVFNKLPKAGTYKFKLMATTSDGAAVKTVSVKIKVKKKPALKIKVRKAGTSKGVKSVNKDATIFIDLGGANWGWNNNKKKSFYVWKVKNLNTGKVAKWNSKKGKFKKNAFISAEAVAGGSAPVLLGSFTQKGKYQITATVYHNDKKIATKTKKITVN